MKKYIGSINNIR